MAIPEFSFDNAFWALVLAVVMWFVIRCIIAVVFSDKNGDCANCRRFDCEGKSCWYYRRRDRDK